MTEIRQARVALLESEGPDRDELKRRLELIGCRHVLALRDVAHLPLNVNPDLIVRGEGGVEALEALARSYPGYGVAVASADPPDDFGGYVTPDDPGDFFGGPSSDTRRSEGR